MNFYAVIHRAASLARRTLSTPSRRTWVAAAALLLAVGNNCRPVPATPSFGPKIEPYSDGANVYATRCTGEAQPGVVSFKDLLLATYPETASLGIYNCRNVNGTNKLSTHAEGRAFDWRVRVFNQNEKEIADTILGWLFATDRYGHKDFRARRLNIQAIEWDRRRWKSYSNPPGWHPASGHTDHMHIEFNWAGALRWSTWWIPRNSY